MYMEHFEIYMLKSINKIMSRKLKDQLTYNFIFTVEKTIEKS